MLAALPFVSGCGKNLYADFADKNSRAYRVDSAREALNALAFDSAIATVLPVWVANNSDIEAASILAQAYAGRAGLRVLDMFEAIGSELGSKTAFVIFAEHFASVELTATELDDMESAIRVIQMVGDTPQIRRDVTFNFFALFAYYARIGAILRFYAYDASGTLDPTWDACNVSDLPEAEVDRIMPAIPRIQEIIDYLPSSGSFDGGGFPDGLFARNALGCPSSGVDALRCSALRTLVNDSTVGLGNNNVCP